RVDGGLVAARAAGRQGGGGGGGGVAAAAARAARVAAAGRAANAGGPVSGPPAVGSVPRDPTRRDARGRRAAAGHEAELAAGGLGAALDERPLALPMEQVCPGALRGLEGHATHVGCVVRVRGTRAGGVGRRTCCRQLRRIERAITA